MEKQYITHVDGFISHLKIQNASYQYYNLHHFKEYGYKTDALPKSIRLLLENSIRNYDGKRVRKQHIDALLGFGHTHGEEVAFVPARIVLQDFTGVPAVVDLAAMREAVAKEGLDPQTINPKVPVDLIIDHSVMVDDYGRPESLNINVNKEYERNQERYRFLKWAQNSFKNFRAVPPSTGIIHQVNLEYLATVVAEEDEKMLLPDTLVGTDSHTTMINGIGVLGWGVGGIEAEAGMLGQPVYFVVPEVIGVKLRGRLREGVTSTDLALTVTHLLRQENVVGKFVEFFGDGVKELAVPDRATVSNMSPEYGATMGYFPVDDATIDYLRLTGRSEEQLEKIESYLRAQGLYGSKSDGVAYTKVVELDLGQVVASVAGPKRPQDKVAIIHLKEDFNRLVTAAVDQGGFAYGQEKLQKKVDIELDGKQSVLTTGAVVMAAITSCTNTANPSVMIGAGLLAKKAVEKGLMTPDYVKTSLTPGSLVVTEYLKKANVLESLEALGFYIAGYGCATCIGNSGPLKENITKAIVDEDLLVASVLSGNRNFEGRIHPYIKANYLASPMLVVAYALAGKVTIDFGQEAIGKDRAGEPVYLKDLWPSTKEINQAIELAVDRDSFIEKYADIYTNNNLWNQVDAPSTELYQWEESSTYIRKPEFFDHLKRQDSIKTVEKAKVLLYLGDSITTDHISPAGSISPDSPAAAYLKGMGVEAKDFNSYGSRRGNHEVMMRGTFANVRIRNRLVEKEGGYTLYQPNSVLSVYDAAMKYQEDKTPLIIIAGKEYGTGSSRDWAAKGTNLLGVKAVIAESYERIHRSNLVGMGVLPLQFMDGYSAEYLGLTGLEDYDIHIVDQEKARVTVKNPEGEEKTFEALIRLDSQVDSDYYLAGGILHHVLLDMSKA